jgi:multiple sugar transport system ATP-binding protein
MTEDIIAASTDEGEDEMPLLAEEAVHARFCARVDARTRVRPGDRIRLSVDPSRFHYFDPHTGRSVGAGSAEPATASASA